MASLEGFCNGRHKRGCVDGNEKEDRPDHPNGPLFSDPQSGIKRCLLVVDRDAWPVVCPERRQGQACPVKHVDDRVVSPSVSDRRW